MTAPSRLDATTDNPAATDFDTLLFLSQGACDGSELACNDDVDYDNGEFRSRLTTSLAPGTYFLFVDAASPTVYGRFDREPRHYQLAVTLTREGDM